MNQRTDHAVSSARRFDYSIEGARLCRRNSVGTIVPQRDDRAAPRTPRTRFPAVYVPEGAGR